MIDIGLKMLGARQRAQQSPPAFSISLTSQSNRGIYGLDRCVKELLEKKAAAGERPRPFALNGGE